MIYIFSLLIHTNERYSFKVIGNESLYLSENESDDGHCSAEESGEHEDLEAIDDALVLEATGAGHGSQRLSFGIDVDKHLKNRCFFQETSKIIIIRLTDCCK